MIKELSILDLDNHHDSWDSKTVPDLSGRNLEILFNKINEIIEYVNECKHRVTLEEIE